MQPLREQAARNVLLDETMITFLTQEVSTWTSLTPELALQVNDTIRRHRVGIIKQKAILSLFDRTL